MHQLENTLYLMTQGAYLHLDHETLKVELEGNNKVQIPLHHLGAIFCFGNIMMSPFLIHRCAEDGRQIVWLSQNGRFKARLKGPTHGNVLLRKDQILTASEPEKSLNIARNIVAGKIKNSRQILQRASRESDIQDEKEKLFRAEKQLARNLVSIPGCSDLDELRGCEGDASRIYYSVFDLMIRKEERQHFQMINRSRRPPRDRINALISFLYTILTNDVIGAIEGVGMDPQVGFLHSIRSGRPALALDLVEEFRSVIADRLALTLINRKQINYKNFEEKTGGAVLLDEEGRKTVVVALQKRKQDEILHPLAQKKIPIALIPHLQARIMARHLRGEIEGYIPFLYR